MIYVIDLLNTGTVEKINKIFDRTSSFKPAGMSNGELKLDVKNNTEIKREDPYYMECINLVRSCIDSSVEFQGFTSSKQYGSFIFSQYTEGMFYDNHVDYHTMSGIRTDYSCTVFLSDKHSYEGGELVINFGNVEQSFKLDAGKALLYPTSFVHRVNRVESGVRRACIFWIESKIKDSRIREINSDLFDLIYKYGDEIKDSNREVYNRVVNIQFNLFKNFSG